MTEYRRPRGTQDILPNDENSWYHVENVFRKHCHKAGFGRIRTPTIESTNLFANAVGADTDIVDKEMYSFTDRGGDGLTLRPEGTAPVLRAFHENGMASLPQPTRLYYIERVFRYDRPQAGRYREHQQLGAELLGEEDSGADIEIISIIWNFLTELGIPDLTLNLNSIGDPKDKHRYQQALMDYYSPYLNNLCVNCKRRLNANPLRLLDCKTTECSPYKDEAPKPIDYLSQQALSHFEQLQAGLHALSIPFVINHTLVRGLDYYTRTVFEIWPARTGSQSTIAGGGRYDLLSDFITGDNVPGVGFGCGIERVLLNMPKLTPQRRPDVYVASLSEATQLIAVRLVSELRSIGANTVSGYKAASPRSHLRKANSQNARFAVIIGDKEAESGTVTLRDLDSGEQSTVAISKIGGKILSLSTGK
tara:strand:+ start:313 stop:1572 length:1260 start_codon:yes stop_codon:yes gene_type:complete